MMYKYCCVSGCESQRNNSDNISFHCFPKEERFVFIKNDDNEIVKVNTKDLWIEKLQVKKTVSKNVRVCSKHFKADDYLIQGFDRKIKRLKSIAVPSQNLPEGNTKLDKSRKECTKNLKRKPPNILAKNALEDSRKKPITDTHDSVEEKVHHKIKILQDLVLKPKLHIPDRPVENVPQNGSACKKNSINSVEELFPTNRIKIEDFNDPLSEPTETKKIKVENEHSYTKAQIKTVGTQTIHKCNCLLLPDIEQNTKLQVKATKVLLEINEIICEKFVNQELDVYAQNIILKVFEEFYFAARRFYKVSTLQLLKASGQLKALTGISFDILDILTKVLQTLKPYDLPNVDILTECKIILCLIKLRLNLSFESLACLFHISVPECKLVFFSTLRSLKSVLKSAVYWPTVEDFPEIQPADFENFKKTVVLMDRTEISVKQTDCAHCKLSDANNPVHSRLGVKPQAACDNESYRVLLGFSQCGLVTYVGKASTRKATNTVITDEEAISRHLLPANDAIMTDGLFFEEEGNRLFINLLKGVKELKIYQDAPKYKGSKKVKRPNLESPAEQAFKQFKLCNIFRSNLPTEMAYYINDISVVICGIVNLSNPVMVDKAHDVDKA